MSCCDEKIITIYKGFPTRFNQESLLFVTFPDSDIDFTGFKAKFKIGGIVKEYEDIADGFPIDLTKEETSTLDIGLQYGELIIIDNNGRARPFTTALPCFVKTFVEGDIELDHFDVSVKMDIKENILNIRVKTEGGSAVDVDEKISAHNQNEQSHPFILGELDKKVDKVSDANKVYGTDENGEQTTYDAGSFGQVDDVKVGGVSVVQNKIASLGTMAGETASNYRKSSDQDTIDTGLSDRIDDIEDLIPEQASTSNQLADRLFVNSSIATNTANFIGTFNSLEELEQYSGELTNNDYAFVISKDEEGNTVYNRYKYAVDEWLFEYSLNNSSFTADQWSAINSGVTESSVQQIGTNAQAIEGINNSDVMKSGISSTKVAQYDGYATSKQDFIDDLTEIRENAQAGKGASDTIATYGNIVTHNVSEFATSAQGVKADSAIQGVQVNGSDLTPDVNKKVNVQVPTNTNQLTNGAGFVTARYDEGNERIVFE